ncbi:MAG: class B sortase [Clostridiales bacterium]|nr:class B sortase [Clostridiales bacterium]
MKRKRKLGFGRRLVRLVDDTINFVLFMGLLVMLGFGSYALWDSKQVFAQANVSNYQEFKPTQGEESLSYLELKALNPDVFGWLTVYGTNIDYPMVQGEDNMYYVSYDVKKNYCISGSIFLDYMNQRDFSDFNSVFYGHHMAEAAMFGDIGLFTDEDYFDERPYGNLYYDGKNHGIEFFAFLETDAYNQEVFATPVEGEKKQQEYIDNLWEIAMYKRDEIEVTIEDRLVLLSTCTSTSTNGRHLLVGKVIDEPFEVPDAFK